MGIAKFEYTLGLFRSFLLNSNFSFNFKNFFRVHFFKKNDVLYKD